ncbi:MAG: hypothetical protein IPN68_00765 [Bacteroidetes bacterium]|nr:hypothetical protein [Bacteroidota bacterium]
MKKINFIILTIISLSLSGCSWLVYDNFQKFDDEFKNSKKYIARAVLYPEERGPEINSANIIIEREVISDRDVVKAYFVISRTTKSFKIENSGYIKAGNQTFEINVAEAVSEYKSKSESSVSSYTRTDSTGVSTGQSTVIDEQSWIDDKFIFILTPEMVSGIRNADEFIVRFYFGPVPATFKFKGSSIKNVHKALNS